MGVFPVHLPSLFNVVYSGLSIIKFFLQYSFISFIQFLNVI
nr:MAG TPA: hypothetical protein [Caudoviricetes sp.]